MKLYTSVVATVLLMMTAPTLQDYHCITMFRQDVLQHWKIRKGSFLCDLFLPYDSTTKVIGIRSYSKGFFFSNGASATSDSESWYSSLYTHNHDRFGIQLNFRGNPSIQFIFEVTTDKKLWATRMRSSDQEGSATILFVSDRDIDIEGYVAHISLIGSLISAAIISVVLVFLDLHTIAGVMFSLHSIFVLLVQILVVSNEDLYTIIFGFSLLASMGMGVLARLYKPRQSRTSALLSVFVTFIYFFNANAGMWAMLTPWILIQIAAWYFISTARYPNNTVPEKIELRLFEVGSFFSTLLVVCSTLAFSYPIQIYYTMSTGSFYPRRTWELDSATILITSALGAATVACQLLVSSSLRKAAILELPMSVEEPNLMISNLV